MYAENFMPTKGMGVKNVPLGRKYRLNYYADNGMPIRMNEMRIAPIPGPGHRLTPKRKPFNPVAVIGFVADQQAL
jgi:hypothetical protein